MAKSNERHRPPSSLLRAVKRQCHYVPAAAEQVTKTLDISTGWGAFVTGGFKARNLDFQPGATCTCVAVLPSQVGSHPGAVQAAHAES